MAFIGRAPPRGPGRFLAWKIRLIAVGAVLLLVGMAREMDLLVLAATVVLAGAFALRFFEQDDEEERDDEMREGEPDAEEWAPHRRELNADDDRMRPAD